MNVGLYIPCYNAERYIDDVLRNVFVQTVRPVDVLAIDDASTDNTLAILQKYPIRIIRNSRNLGLTACRNIAIKNMGTDLVAALDSDCMPDSHWLEHLVKVIMSSEIAGAGGALKERHTETPCDLWRSVHMKQHWGNDMQEPSFLFGSNTVFRKEALEKIGLYNEAYQNNYEDVALCKALVKEGYRLMYIPQATAYHLRRDTISSLFKTYWKWYFPFYQEEKFYTDEDRFFFKLKDNIGLSNRHIKEDIAAGMEKLLYLDFLLSIDHSFRDLHHFCYPDFYCTQDNVHFLLWLSFVDLNLCVHLDPLTEELPTVISKENAFVQDFMAINLLLGRVIDCNFQNPEFLKQMYDDLLKSIYDIYDPVLANKLFDFFIKCSEWKKLGQKKQGNSYNRFLKIMFLLFDQWIPNLRLDFSKIKDSFERYAYIPNSL